MPPGNHICDGHLFTFAAQHTDAFHSILPTSGDVENLLEKTKKPAGKITKGDYRDLAVKTK